MADRRERHNHGRARGAERQAALSRRLSCPPSQTAPGSRRTDLRGPTFISPSALAGLVVAILVAGCGAAQATTATTRPAAAAAAATRRSLPPDWESATPPPKVTPALIRQTGYGLTAANANIGTVDEVIGAQSANVHVNPSAKTLDNQYTRFGRCIAEQMKIHDLGHELVLLIAYVRKDRTLQATVEKASSVCAGLAITPDANYKQSLKANP
jgi:hypothetical protein